MKLIPLVLAALMLSACSLNYDEQVKSDGVVPEFIFSNTRFTRYENRNRTMELEAETLEQYKSDSASFAKNAKFTTWKNDGTVDTEGSCVLLSINTNEKVYTLFNDIVLKNNGQNVEIHAQNLKWDSNTEQLVSGANDRVRIRQDNLELEGKGFSASGVSQSFRFSKPVRGTITETDGDSEKAE